jgi:hypothetical protein
MKDLPPVKRPLLSRHSDVFKWDFRGVLGPWSLGVAPCVYYMDRQSIYESNIIKWIIIYTLSLSVICFSISTRI